MQDLHFCARVFGFTAYAPALTRARIHLKQKFGKRPDLSPRQLEPDAKIEGRHDVGMEIELAPTGVDDFAERSEVEKQVGGQ
jgi:hypothetical protein